MNLKPTYSISLLLTFSSAALKKLYILNLLIAYALCRLGKKCHRGKTSRKDRVSPLQEQYSPSSFIFWVLPDDREPGETQSIGSQKEERL